MNSVDSDKYTNFKAPEKDWVLNEAARVWVKTIAMPRYESPVHFEMNSRTISDIYKVVINQNESSSSLTKFGEDSYIYDLEKLDPEFWFFLSGEAVIKRGNCIKTARLFDEQHDDMHEQSSFSSSDFNWGEVNFRHFSKGLRLFADFEIQSVQINYIKRLKYMYNATNYRGNYRLLSTGQTVTDSQDSEFSYSREICAEIVDIAVLLLSNGLVNDYATKADKLRLTDKRI